MNRPVPDFHIHFTDPDALSLREAVGEFAADHSLDDPVLRYRFGSVTVDGFDGGTVTHDGYLIGYIRNFVELVGNDDHGHSLLLEAQHQIQKSPGVFLIQGRRRLVQNQQLRVLCECFRNLDQLLFAGSDFFNQNPGILRKADHLQIFVRLRVGFIPVDSGFLSSFIAEIHILADRHLRNQRQFLMNDNDSAALGVFNRIETADLAVVDNISLIGSVRIDAAQNIHQRGLSGAVLAYEGMDLAFLNLKIDVVESFYARKGLCNALHLQ